MPTSYLGNIRTLLMRGKIFRQQGSKLAGKGHRKHLSSITNTIDPNNGFAMGGTISHRPLNPDLMPNFERFRISSGKGMSMNAANASILSSMARINKATRKKASKKSSGKKKGNFKSLKFNF